MIRRILSIAGKPGLYRMISQGKNMLIVEALATGKRMPAYGHEKIISLADISIYTTEGDKPLPEVLDMLYEKAEGKPVDLKSFGSDAEIREFFAQVLPYFDNERVYTTDIKKLISWYNLLLANGFTKFADLKVVAKNADGTPIEEATAEDK